jgi:hypothetical protein
MADYRCSRCGRNASIKVNTEGVHDSESGLTQYNVVLQIPGFTLKTHIPIAGSKEQAQAAADTLLAVLGLEKVP